MSNWTIDYHRQHLKDETGQDWFPIDKSAEIAAIHLGIAKAKVRLLKSAIHLLNSAATLAGVLILAGIVLAFIGFYRTAGPICAMVIPSAVFAPLMLWARFYLGLRVLPPLQIEQIATQKAYQRRLDQECGL